MALNISNVIAQIETGGTLDCSLVGGSGEKGCHQFTQATWEAYSKEIFGSIKEQTPENSEYVAEQKIYKWLISGYSEKDIFLTWNQGNKGNCKSGVNKFGVKYDSCAYVEKALKLLGNITKT